MKHIIAQIIFDKYFPIRICSLIIKNKKYNVSKEGIITDKHNRVTDMKIFAVDYDKGIAEIIMQQEGNA